LTDPQYPGGTPLQQQASTAMSALSELHSTLQSGATTGPSAAGAGPAGGVQGQQVSAQDVQALDFWGDLLGTALKVAPVLISLLEAEQGGAQQQQVRLQSVSAQDWQSIVGDVLKLIPQVISMFSTKIQQIGPQNVTALFDWGGLLKVGLDALPSIISLFQVEQGGAQQQQVRLQSVSAQDWQSIVGSVLKTLPVIISLFQAQQVQGQATVNALSTQETPPQPQQPQANLIIS
jgi:hypothetical protein